MQIARYQTGGEIHHGIVTLGGYRRLPGDLFGSLEPTGILDRVEDTTLLAPIAKPRIFGVGLNYVSHIAEAGAKTPAFPMLFMKPDSAATGPDAPVVYPLEGEHVDYEAEMALVIGKRVRRVAPEQALDAVLGVTCANDFSERKIQFAEMDTGCMLIGKAYDGFCPIGPVIATGLNPDDLLLQARLNGETRQSCRTSDLLFGSAELVAYLSRAITLEPGDVIITGTPAGVGPVKPGDVVEIELEGVGVLRNEVVAETA